MAIDPVLLLGGSGVIGRQTAQMLRAAHPKLELLIGGRDAAKAAQLARELGLAEGVALDMAAADLGLGARPVGAVAVFVKDDALAGLRFALDRRLPHVSISSGVQEMGPEVAAWMYAPQRAAVVLGTEWLVGATSLPALHAAEAFARVDEIVLGALVDPQDTIGPAADTDLERLGKTLPAALTRRDGAWGWRLGEDSPTSARTSLLAIDGTPVEAAAYATNDVLVLATATGAADVQFNLATGITSSRRRGEAFSTEILIEMGGIDHHGRRLRTRHAVMHPRGQGPLTALGVSMVVERLLGLDGAAPAPRGLYFPSQILDRTRYLARLDEIGGRLLRLG